jgi:hypothetical protein
MFTSDMKAENCEVLGNFNQRYSSASTRTDSLLNKHSQGTVRLT